MQIGSVDEESKSDEEYDDLAMLDKPDTGYWSDDDEPKQQFPVVTGTQQADMQTDKHSKNLDQSLRCRREQMKPPLCSYSSMVVERNVASPGKMRKRSQSIPTFGKHGPVINNDPILSGALQS